jgi:N-acetylneuraminate synthase
MRDHRFLFILEMANNHMGDVAHGIRIVKEMQAACAGFDFRFAIKLQYRHLPFAPLEPYYP